jgi:hypothetical protein
MGISSSPRKSTLTIAYKLGVHYVQFVMHHCKAICFVLQLKVQPKKQLQTNICSIDISCIKWKAMEVFHRVFEACQRISTCLNIPLSVFLVAAVNGKQAIEVMDNNKRDSLLYLKWWSSGHICILQCGSVISLS